jgi:hypothetical protein
VPFTEKHISITLPNGHTPAATTLTIVFNIEHYE